MHNNIENMDLKTFCEIIIFIKCNYKTLYDEFYNIFVKIKPFEIDFDDFGFFNFIVRDVLYPNRHCECFKKMISLYQLTGVNKK